MRGIRAAVALGTILVLMGSEMAVAATRRIERGPERVTVATEKGQQGYRIEYEQYTFESVKDRVAAVSGGKLTQTEATSLLAEIKRGKKSWTASELQTRVNRIIATRPRPKPKPKPRPKPLPRRR